MSALLRRLLTAHPLLTFVLMGLFAVAFGLISLNIFNVLRANLALIAEHGTMALLDGAAWQLAELVVSGYLSLGCYVLFKVCERVLVERALR